MSAAHTDIDVRLTRVTEEIRYRPNDYSLYLIRGELKRYNEDWPGAEADFARAEILAPAEVREELLLYRGRLFEEAGQSRRAVAELDKYMALHPKHVDALRVRARAYARMGEFKEAIADYTRLITLDAARSPELWLERARLSVTIGGVDNAVANMDAAIVVFGPLVTLVEFAIDAEIGRHHYAAALDRMEQLPAALMEAPEWLWRRGTLLEQLDRPDDAARVYALARQAILDMPPRRQKTAAMQDLLAKLQVPLSQPACR